MRSPMLAAALSLSLGLTGCSGDPAPTGPGSDGPQAATATALTFIHVSAGGTHSCAVSADHRAWCWGSNLRGQLGDGGTADRLLPTRVAGGLLFLDVTAGDWHTCGITTDNRAYCWGLDDAGELGTAGSAACSGKICRQPVAVAGSRRWRQISAGVSHTCAVTLDDKGFCWGEGDNGELGDGKSVGVNRPVAVSGGLVFRQLTAGAAFTCGLTKANAVYCWGWNPYGQLGDRTKISRPTPGKVFGGLSFRQVRAGFFFACGVTIDDVAYCWGNNFDGRTGTGKDDPRILKPTPVAGGLRFSRVTAGLGHGCGVAITGRAWCWGNNALGELGNGSLENSPVPVAVPGFRTWLEVRAGPDAAHTCGISTAGQAFCWGWNNSGQLGDGTTQTRASPVPILVPMN